MSSARSYSDRARPASRSIQPRGSPWTRPCERHSAGAASRRLQLAGCHSMRASPGWGPVSRRSPADTCSARDRGVSFQSTATRWPSRRVQVPGCRLSWAVSCSVSTCARQAPSPKCPAWAAAASSRRRVPACARPRVFRRRDASVPVRSNCPSETCQTCVGAAPGAPRSRRGTASWACTWSWRPCSFQPPFQVAFRAADPRTVPCAHCVGMPGQLASQRAARLASVTCAASAPAPWDSLIWPARVTVPPGRLRFSRASPLRRSTWKFRLPWSWVSSVCTSRAGRAREPASQRPWARKAFRRWRIAEVPGGAPGSGAPVRSASKVQACRSMRAVSWPFSEAAASRESAAAGFTRCSVARASQASAGASVPFGGFSAVGTDCAWARMRPPAATASSDSMIHWPPA
jgi:hypothetical protein